MAAREPQAKMQPQTMGRLFLIPVMVELAFHPVLQVLLFIAEAVAEAVDTMLAARPAGLEAAEPERTVIPAAAQAGGRVPQIQVVEAEAAPDLEDRLQAPVVRGLLLSAYPTP